MAVVQKIRIQLGFVELLHHYRSDRSDLACAQCQQICWPDYQGAYEDILNIISGTSKFKVFKDDLTSSSEMQLQRFLKKSSGQLDTCADAYPKIYPT